jgi:hypothetical protein
VVDNVLGIEQHTSGIDYSVQGTDRRILQFLYEIEFLHLHTICDFDEGNYNLKGEYIAYKTKELHV